MPWLTEQATHPAAVARQLAYMAAQGQEGLGSPLDCRVSALDVPGPYIRASTGSYSILNRTQGYSQQMYVGRVSAPDQVAVAPTSSTGGRTDLVIIRIENPDTDGWTPPTDRANGPYAFTRVIQGVPAGAVDLTGVNNGSGWSALVLARITLPANTGTITNAMITDLRGTQQSPLPSVATFSDIQDYSATSTLPPPATGSGSRASAWLQWPAGAQWTVPVPSWATAVSMYYTVNPGMLDNTWGELAIDFNGRWTTAKSFDVNYPLNGSSRVPYTNDGSMRADYKAGGTIPVLAADRGRNVPVRVMARSFDDVVYRARGASVVDRGSVGFLQVIFKQAAATA